MSTKLPRLMNSLNSAITCLRRSSVVDAGWCRSGWLGNASPVDEKVRPRAAGLTRVPLVSREGAPGPARVCRSTTHACAPSSSRAADCHGLEPTPDDRASSPAVVERASTGATPPRSAFPEPPGERDSTSASAVVGQRGTPSALRAPVTRSAWSPPAHHVHERPSGVASSAQVRLAGARRPPERIALTLEEQAGDLDPRPVLDPQPIGPPRWVQGIAVEHEPGSSQAAVGDGQRGDPAAIRLAAEYPVTVRGWGGHSCGVEHPLQRCDVALRSRRSTPGFPVRQVGANGHVPAVGEQLGQRCEPVVVERAAGAGDQQRTSWVGPVCGEAGPTPECGSFLGTGLVAARRRRSGRPVDRR
jgi:hypothetical protein